MSKFLDKSTALSNVAVKKLFKIPKGDDTVGLLAELVGSHIELKGYKCLSGGEISSVKFKVRGVSSHNIFFRFAIDTGSKRYVLTDEKGILSDNWRLFQFENKRLLLKYGQEIELGEFIGSERKGFILSEQYMDAKLCLVRLKDELTYLKDTLRTMVPKRKPRKRKYSIDHVIPEKKEVTAYSFFWEVNFTGEYKRYKNTAYNRKILDSKITRYLSYIKRLSFIVRMAECAYVLHGGRLPKGLNKVEREMLV